MAAYECNSVEFKTYGEDSFVCPINSIGDVSLWKILRKVQIEALLWGFGTAIGELPPYFVARAARLSGESLSELEKLDEEPSDSFIQNMGNTIKKTTLSLLDRFGFIGIMLFASIPNPLFDLAGITCGHFLVPFWKFFGATAIGKAIIKTHLQTLFVILMFTKELFTYVIKQTEYLLPFLTGTIDEFLEKEKAKFHRVGGSFSHTEKSMLALCWDILLMLMIFYFLLSILNSSVQGYLLQKDEEEIANINI